VSQFGGGDREHQARRAALTASDLSDDEFPGQSHFPNDQVRPLLDRCYRPLGNDLPFVVDVERREIPERCSEGDGGVCKLQEGV
jgi:hypothetical protein